MAIHQHVGVQLTEIIYVDGAARICWDMLNQQVMIVFGISHGDQWNDSTYASQ